MGPLAGWALAGPLVALAHLAGRLGRRCLGLPWPTRGGGGGRARPGAPASRRRGEEAPEKGRARGRGGAPAASFKGRRRGSFKGLPWRGFGLGQREKRER